ncbi:MULTISPECIES: 4-(cytidine 5'-diphospho)-2-C-methyl-D-erythritol kinase [Phyllobacteriaceae]|uniref:4-diphosphocytidyl-2-C-methyl-D-erythritol kinase n=2 Tax=Pseudomonadota TaxID=1224 RepID=A0A1C2DJI3_9HYPH|nr:MULTISPECIES: 4-(cytidine 5'-diphospho)-2-C-methyl-D-erythritol kinase [Mesorhizobium]MBN9233337.1 4-(cytidine 5'-diphospho)-2-C-methyl-D-erythritol kinase [Mesorhizobium sp.]MDQ0331974.1 4-diphosphocytidyl-2-C-methyl-D-erythritol kinase [Mesorhizobium sp. YL-MeA3-2017]OCX14924.1 4-(cytidine 5'-diphospho)-2-C-methyl-D-erythritol kinase [Mesorhizobium hungaricum]
MDARLAPAKINLALHVTGKRDDGYHVIESLAVFTRFGDRVEAQGAEQDRFDISGRFAGLVPADETNLILKARDALRDHVGPLKAPAVAITLEKNLPVASGVGGGSSDAAATLRALASIWNLDIGEAELARIGFSLGADLPMCLKAQPLLAHGAGETVSTVADFPALGLVLVNPGVAVGTAAVFATLARRDNEGLPPLPKAIDFHSLRGWLEITRNDLEPAAEAIAPLIGKARAALLKAGAGFARMSGSGATCFGLFETGNVAKRAAATIRTRHPDWFVAATRSMASEGSAHEHA